MKPMLIIVSSVPIMQERELELGGSTVHILFYFRIVTKRTPSKTEVRTRSTSSIDPESLLRSVLMRYAVLT